ncbi:MAG TPA: ABC transporter permease, partial [Cyclobacteriaceae bacterium]|nr:ABC transporter permease [Cyclobacteriaceae bacterium]
MIRNYLIIALRYILRHKVFTFINISGLTFGITCSFFIFLYVQDELSYDRFHPDADRIYRLSMNGSIQGKNIKSVYTGAPLIRGFREEIPVLEDGTRLVSWSTFPARYEEKTFTEKYLLLADANFFKFFNFELIEGAADSVLNGEAKIVITESAARRYFNYKGRGDKSPIGKTIAMAQGYKARITGIAKDPPPQSHFHFTLILSLDSWTEIVKSEEWMHGAVINYLKLKTGHTIDDQIDKMRRLFNYHVNEEMKKYSTTDLQGFIHQGNRLTLTVQPLNDIHLRSDLDDEIEVNGNIQRIYLFSAIALFITVLACINFMNLFTARSAERSKEIGIRKAAGAQNFRLIGQFMMETYLYVLTAMVISLFITLILLAPFNYFTGKQIAFSTLFQPYFIAGASIFTILTGALASSYPAFYLTRFNPVDVLRGRVRKHMYSYGIRNILVVFQFFVSCTLIIATIVVYHQLTFFSRVDLGFDKTNLVNILHTKNLGDKGKAFKEDLLTHSEIVSASYSNRLPPDIDWQQIFRVPDSNKEFILNVYEMDPDHLKTMGYTLLKGRFFEKGDSNVVIINESAAKVLGIKAPEEKKIFSYFYSAKGTWYSVIGIVKNFNFQSLKEPIHPLALLPAPEPYWEMAVRLAPGEREKKLELIQSLFKKYAPNVAFKYSFVDENFEAKHSTERRVGWLFLLFTSLAIFIACLGLLGLAAFMAEQRTKEIGIRKAVGASVGNIIALLNKDFLKLVLIANVLA